MKKEIYEEVLSNAEILKNSPTGCNEAKLAAEEFINALGTENEKDETVKFIKELEEDIEPIDDLIAFATSPLAKRIFGDKAEGFKEHAYKLKAAGAKYCDCPACSACANILKYKDELLG